MLELSDIAAVTLVGFAGGTVLGLAARLARFCTLGAIEDALYGGSRERILMWPMALGVAIATTAILSALGLAAVEDAAYLRYGFSLSASVVGGLTFGIGMALAGNCGFGSLARVGGGDIRSMMVVLAIGISAYAVAVGPLSEWRTSLFPREELTGPGGQSIAAWLSGLTGLPALAIALVIASGLLAIAILDRSFVRNRSAIVWSVLVGLAISSAWWGTSHVAATGFSVVPVESHTFTMPLGEITLQIMGVTSDLGGFSVGSVLGVLFGAFVGARIRKQFRWEACDDAGELRRQLLGSVLMGAGGVVALGCSVGQGLSAFSVLAISAPVTLASIACGAVIGLRYLIEGRGVLLAPFEALPRLFRGRSGSR